MSIRVPKVSHALISKQCTHNTMTQIRVTDEVRDKLMHLRGVMHKRNVNDVIVSLMISRQYDDAFFERQREEHFMTMKGENEE